MQGAAIDRAGFGIENVAAAETVAIRLDLEVAQDHHADHRLVLALILAAGAAGFGLLGQQIGFDPAEIGFALTINAYPRARSAGMIVDGRPKTLGRWRDFGARSAL